MKSDYFIEFVYYEPALKQEEQFKFLIQKYKESIESLKEIKNQKINGIDKFLMQVDAFENEVKELKKSLPTEQFIEEVEKPERTPIKQVKKVTKKTVKKIVKNKTTIRKAGKSLSDLRLGLEKIKDELSRM